MAAKIKKRINYISACDLDFQGLWEGGSESSLLVSERNSLKPAQGLLWSSFKKKNKKTLCPCPDPICTQAFTMHLLGRLCSVLPVLSHSAPGDRRTGCSQHS